MVFARCDVLAKQVQAFASGTMAEYAFPAELTAEERKVVKMTAEKLGLSSQSFGMGTDRQIHIFKPTASLLMAKLEPMKYSVKNTFVDGHMESEQDVLGPDTKSMPAGTFQEQLAKEDSLCSSQCDTGSTVESESEDPPPLEFFSIKNSFVHFEETDAKEYQEPRIIQSMPNGRFAECLKLEELVSPPRSQKKRPGTLNNDEEIETCSGMLFPATPNAETTFDSTPERFPEHPMPPGSYTTVLAPAMLLQESSTTVLSPAMFGTGVTYNGPPTAGTVESSMTVLPPAMMGQEPSTVVLQPAVWSSPATIQQMTGPIPAVASPAPFQEMQLPVPVPAPPQGSPPGLAPGMPVVLCGLANQPAFNGLCGTISSFDAECGRYNITLQVASKKQQMVKVKSENLLLAEPSLPPQPSCFPPAQPLLPLQPPCYTHAVQQQATARSRLVLDTML